MKAWAAKPAVWAGAVVSIPLSGDPWFPSGRVSMERFLTQVDWHIQDNPINLSGDWLKRVAIDDGDGYLHPSAHV
jgi:hypothetical protein